MSAALLDRLTTPHQAQAVGAGGERATVATHAGVVARWQVEVGQVVEAYAKLGLLNDEGGGGVAILARSAGTITRLVPVGAKVEKGEAVALMAPSPEAPQAPPPRAPAAPPHQSAQARQAPPRPDSAPERPTNGRRGLVAPVEVEDLSPTPAPQPRPMPAPRPRKAQRVPKVKPRTTRPLDTQGEAFDALIERLRAAGHDLERSELERTMYGLFLGLGDAAIVEAAYSNRDAEEAGRYGAGANPARMGPSSKGKKVGRKHGGEARG